jgi:hypothetical protein
VLTPDRGWVSIDQIKRGDKVVSVDADGKKTTAEVKGMKVTPNQDYRLINGIRMTHLQEVLIDGKGYKEVRDLKLGDAMVDVDGKLQKITSIKEDPHRETVYNLIMADHSIPFYAAGVLVRDWQRTDPELRK